MLSLFSENLKYGCEHVFLLLASLCFLGKFATADCPRPSVPDSIYILSAALNSFPHGDTFEVVCLPGYKPESVTILDCEKSGSWKGNLPECEKVEVKIRWWILLITLVSVIVLVPCIVPRVYYHFSNKPHVTRLQQHYRRKVTKDKLKGIELTSIKRTDQDFSDTDSGGVHFNNKNDNWLEKYPEPLPPIRRSQKVYSQDQPEGVNRNSSNPSNLPPLQPQGSGRASANDQVFYI